MGSVFHVPSGFFPRVRTPCGRSAQAINEGKGNHNMMRGKGTQATPNAKQTPTKQEPQTQRLEAESPHLKVFPLYEGETGEKS